MGKLAAAMLSSFLAVVVGAAGIALALWVAAALYRVEWAREWAVWTMEHSPLPLYAPSIRVADDLIQRDALIAVGLAAAVLCLMAFSLLRFVRKALRSADESHDGKGTLELKTQPLRVGRPVEGDIWLTHDPAQGQLYRVELSCKRDHGSGRSEGSEIAYAEELEVAPVRAPVGWSLPFRFAVPPIAPPSGASRHMNGPGYSWRLAFRRSLGWISFPSVFALNLAPAPPEELRALEQGESGRREPGLRRAGGGIARDAAQEPLLQERAELRQPPPPALEPEPAIMADNRVAGYASSFPLHERPEFRDPPPVADFGTEQARQTSMFTKALKWLFLVLFGGVLAVSAVAVATAMLLRYFM